jgi:hypothetical protein
MVSIRERQRRRRLELAIEIRGQDVSGASFVESSRSLNLSGGGLLFETERRLLVGTALQLRIQLPAALRRPFGGRPEYRARAVVCRVERFEGSRVSRIGVRFLGEAPA